MTEETFKRAIEIKKETDKIVKWQMSITEQTSSYQVLIKQLKEIFGEEDAKEIASYIDLKYNEKVEKLNKELKAL